MHASPAKHSYVSVTDRQTGDGQSDPYVSLCFAGDTIKIVTAFQGMHVSPAKHCYASVTDGQTDDGQSDLYVSLCFAGDTKMVILARGKSTDCVTKMLHVVAIFVIRTNMPSYMYLCHCVVSV